MGMAIACAAVLGFLFGGCAVTSFWFHAKTKDGGAWLVWGMLTQLAADVRRLQLRDETGAVVLVDTREVAEAVKNGLLQHSWNAKQAG